MPNELDILETKILASGIPIDELLHCANLLMAARPDVVDFEELHAAWQISRITAVRAERNVPLASNDAMFHTR